MVKVLQELDSDVKAELQGVVINWIEKKLSDLDDDDEEFYRVFSAIANILGNLTEDVGNPVAAELSINEEVY